MLVENNRDKAKPRLFLTIQQKIRDVWFIQMSHTHAFP